MRLMRRLTDFRSDHRDVVSFWLLVWFRCRFHSSLAAYRLFEIALRQHRYAKAEVICGVASHRYGCALEVLTMRCVLSFRSGDLDSGFILLDDCLKNGDFRALERLLFRTGSRPADLGQRFLVLDRIAEHQDVLFSHRCYARIAQSYQALKLEDKGLAGNLVSPLRNLIARLEEDSSVGCCDNSNRRNSGKMLVSLCTVSYHLALLLQDDSLLAFSWDVSCRFHGKLNFRSLNADACLRMSSNLSRCLAIGLLLPRPSQEECREVILKKLADLEASVIEHCLPAQAGRRYATQENHLVFMAELQTGLKAFLGDGQDVRHDVYEHLSRLLNHSSSASLTDLIKRRLHEVM